MGLFGKWVRTGPAPEERTRRRESRIALAATQCHVQPLESRLLLSAAAHQASVRSAVLKHVEPRKLHFHLEIHKLHNTVRAADAGKHPGVHGALNTGLTSPAGGVTPQQMRGAYGAASINFNGITGDGTGQTIAIIDAYDDPGMVSSSSSSFGTSDLAVFDAAFGLSNPPSFTKVGVNDSTDQTTTTLPGTDPGGPFERTGNDSWAIETSLDVEWAHVMAPKANILLVETGSASDLFNGIVAANNTAGVKVISMSFSGPESLNEGSTANEQSDDSYYFSAPGITYVAATGDSGAYGSGTSSLSPQFPASSSHVVAVGGTTLHVSGNSYSSESAWGNGTSSGSAGGGGGGISLYEPQPGYQVGKVSGNSTSRRTYPDVSMDADPNTGVPIYDSWDLGTGTGWFPGTIGGTSLATPMTAGLIAVADQGRALAGLSTLNSSGVSSGADVHTLLYPLSTSQSDFHDITTGSNGYAAGTGYDLATGIGSPVANNLVPALAPTATVGPQITSNPQNQSVSAGKTVTFTAAATGTPTPTVQWQLSVNGGAFTNISGATSTTYSFTAASGQTGNKYQAVFINSQGTATTTAATLTVNAALTAPVVTGSPQSQSVAAGNTVTFTAAATGNPTPTVQWQVSTSGGAFTNISGATSTTYSFTAAAGQSGNKYQAVFTNSSGSATTTAATLTVTTSSALPSGWTDSDIGSPGKAGGASVNGGTWTVSGGGSDIWNASDQFNFARQSLTGNTTLAATVTSITNTDVWAKAGLMFRASTDPASPFVDMVATESNGVSFQYRTASGAQCTYVPTSGIPAPTASHPIMLRLTRSGSTFTGSYSINGGTSWVTLGSVSIASTAMPATLLGGLAVTAHNNGALNTATFTGVSV